MNPIDGLFLKTITRRPLRAGISIIEVLVSILVAMIGVFGVMVMIPFAVSQVEQGFDQETSLTLGRNAAADYEIKGFNVTSRWELSKRPVPATVVSPGVSTVRAYVIDPIGAADRFVNNGLFTGYFPFVHDEVATGGSLAATIETATANAITGGAVASADKGILIERINLRTNVPASFTPGLARFHFSWQNDLQFRTPTRDDIAAFPLYPTPELAPPQQIFDVDTLTSVRRQTLGEMSYVVIAVPNDVIPNPAAYPTADPETGVRDYVQSFRNYFVVYKRRPLPTPLGAGGTQPFDRVYEVDTTAATGMDIDYSTVPNFTGRIAYAGGSMVLRQNNLLRTANGFSSQRSSVRRGDWIALTNVVFNRTRGRFFQQINFYQVLEATEDPNSLGDWFVSLQGPDFDFAVATDSVGANDSTINPSAFDEYAAFYDESGTGETRPSRTYAIHLPDVWAVFERTTAN